MSYFGKPPYVSGYESQAQRGMSAALASFKLSGRYGFAYSLEVHDCKGILWESGYLFLEEINRSRTIILATSCATRAWAVLTTHLNSRDLVKDSISIRLRIPNLPQKGRLVVTFPLDVESWPDLIKTGQNRVVARRLSRVIQPFGPKSNLRPSPETYVGFRLNGGYSNIGGVVTNNVTSVAFTSFNRVWSGSRTPNFGRLKAKGQLPVNNHTVDLTLTESDEKVHMEYGFNAAQNKPFITQNFTALNNGTLGWTPTGAAHQSSPYNVALRRLISSVGGNSANLAQDIFQVNQTLRLIGDVTTRLSTFMRRLKRGNVVGAGAVLFGGKKPRLNPKHRPDPTKDLAHNVLAYQYGIKPLLMSIDGSMAALARLHLSDAVRGATASASQELVKRGRLFVNEAPPTYVGFWEEKSRTTCRLGIRYSIPSPLIALLGTTGFTNPINLAWELIPFSFVLDWFLPIGPYLEALSAWDGLSFHSGYKTTFTRQDTRGVVNFHGQYASQLGSDRWSWDRGSLTRQRVLLNRESLSSFPSPVVPSFKSGISTTHAINGLALLRAVWKR